MVLKDSINVILVEDALLLTMNCNFLLLLLIALVVTEVFDRGRFKNV